jgi:hypothetical protein
MDRSGARINPNSVGRMRPIGDRRLTALRRPVANVLRLGMMVFRKTVRSSSTNGTRYTKSALTFSVYRGGVAIVVRARLVVR